MFSSRSLASLLLIVLTMSAPGCATWSSIGGGGAARPAAGTPSGPVGPAAVAGSQPGAPAPELARFNDLLATLAERLKPALVHVRVRRGMAVRDDDSDSPGEPRRASGSGFVIDPNGTVVTNAHVVEGSEWIQVRLSDGRRFTATVLGRDSRVDLAILKIEATGLPVLAFGDSNRVRVGEFVLALGHPFGLEHSVSFGIVSRKGAPLTVAAPGFDFIQSDAAINPGNSGGPLVNMAGEVVGVNSMAARNGSIGFAIPANLVTMLMPQLTAKGHVEWGWLGISITEVTDEEVERFKLREAKGVLIRGVMPGEPAEKGGLKPNDIIVALDGTRLDGPRDLQRVVSSSPVGKKMRIMLLREGRETEVEVTIGKYRDPSEREGGERK
ncbi:MAG: S1C family serine protease [Candidatus Rokuibacteriota bacterium]